MPGQPLGPGACSKPEEEQLPKAKKRPEPQVVCEKQPNGGYDPFICELCNRLPQCWDKNLKTYVAIPKVVFDAYLKRYSPHEWLVLLTILRFTDTTPTHKRYGESWITEQKIKKLTGLGRNTIIEALKIFDEDKLVIKTPVTNRRADGTFKGPRNILTITFLKHLKNVHIAGSKGNLTEHSLRIRRRHLTRGEPIDKPRKPKK